MNLPIDGPLPGVAAFEETLSKSLAAAVTAKGEGYVPRTRHLDAEGGPRFTNRLVLESSPYLLQHAHNPVNWRPWGDAAFEEAQRLGRPVLLSVGYSTCHWCHVMEEESFEDLEIARYLNEHYVTIKVDREERPDVDAVYMSAVQSITGRGGWPMTVWLTAERRPYHAGTYFPARDGDRGARIGFLTLLGRMYELHASDPARVQEFSAGVVERIEARLAAEQGAGSVDASVIDRAFQSYRGDFDGTFGGLNRAPKFPSSLPVRVLLRHHLRSGDAEAAHMATLTLEKMAGGGMYDHVGGGFHRYSTDRRWLVPHFEKMLYDNALLTVAYLEGYQATGNADFARVARETLDYIARDMTHPQGGFYSATDADSLTPEGEREEGWFFTWTPGELEEALGKDRARIIGAYYDVRRKGNFEGRSILHTPQPIERVAPSLDLTPAALRAVVNEARETLYQVRGKRPPPLRDEKILAAWNGLMISAAARGGLVLDEPRYIEMARRAAAFVLDHMRVNGRLQRAWTDGKAPLRGYLDDYAFLIQGLLDLFEATGEPRWLSEAIALAGVLTEHFADDEGGGFYFTADDHEQLLVREKPGYDGAEPSGNSVAALALLRLAGLTDDAAYRERGERTLRAFHSTLEASPTALSEMLLAVDYMSDTPKEVVLVAPTSRDQLQPMLDALRTHFVPNHHLVMAVEGEDLAAQAELVPFARFRKVMGGQATAYVCERQICELPTSDPAVFVRQLTGR